MAMKAAMAVLALLALVQEEKLELRWKFHKGQEIRYRAVRKVSVEFQGTPASRETAHTYRMTVTDVDAEGVATLTLRTEAAAIKATGIEELDYDSEKDKELPQEPGARLEALLVGQSYGLKMDPSGRVLEVRGADRVLEDVLRKGGLAGGDELAREALKQMYSDEGLKSRLQQMTPHLPKEKVGRGDRWTHGFSMKVPMVGALKFSMTSRLKEFKDGAAHIEQEPRIELVPAEGDDPLAAKAEIRDLQGSTAIRFGVESGMLLSTQATVALKMMAGGAAIPMKIEGEMRLLEK